MIRHGVALLVGLVFTASLFMVVASFRQRSNRQPVTSRHGDRPLSGYPRFSHNLRCFRPVQIAKPRQGGSPRFPVWESGQVE